MKYMTAPAKGSIATSNNHERAMPVAGLIMTTRRAMTMTAREWATRMILDGWMKLNSWPRGLIQRPSSAMVAWAGPLEIWISPAKGLFSSSIIMTATDVASAHRKSVA